MRKLFSVAAGLTLLLVGTGCVAVSAKNNRWACERAAVVVNDHVYVIDTRTGKAYSVSIDGAGPLPPPDCQ